MWAWLGMVHLLGPNLLLRVLSLHSDSRQGSKVEVKEGEKKKKEFNKVFSMTISESAVNTKVEYWWVTFINCKIKALEAFLISEKEGNLCLPLSAVLLVFTIFPFVG